MKKRIFFGIALLALLQCVSCNNNPVSEKNTAPSAVFNIKPMIGTINTVFEFDARNVSDEEDNTSDLSVRWDWEGDGTFDTDYSLEKTVTHQYDEPGLYPSVLEVKDTDDLVKTNTISINVENTIPIAVFSVYPDAGQQETVFEFDARNVSDEEDNTSDLSVRWDWEGDGTFDTDYSLEKTVTHQYDEPGLYPSVLEVKDTDGLIHISTITVIVFSGTVSDIDGNIYNTVTIGSQVWTVENLKTIRYNNGDIIPNITDTASWTVLNTGAHCVYNNDSTNIDKYGLLYNWYAVNDSSGLAPNGWHVASDSEWKQLERFLGMSQNDANGNDWRGIDEGKKLKDSKGWSSEDNTNDSGFSALPGGYRKGIDGGFYHTDAWGLFWTSTRSSTNNAWFRHLSVGILKINRNYHEKQDGFSVRCIKD